MRLPIRSVNRVYSKSRILRVFDYYRLVFLGDFAVLPPLLRLACPSQSRSPWSVTFSRQTAATCLISNLHDNLLSGCWKSQALPDTPKGAKEDQSNPVKCHYFPRTILLQNRLNWFFYQIGFTFCGDPACQFHRKPTLKFSGELKVLTGVLPTE